MEEDDETDELELSRPYEPVIACLSPTLARLANSRSVWTKTATEAPRSPEVDVIARKRKAEEPSSAGARKTPKSPKRQTDLERLRNRDLI